MTDLFSMISAPAQRALSSVGIKTIIDFTYHTRFEIENLHGIGKKVMILIEKHLESSNLKFMNETDNQEIDEYIDVQGHHNSPPRVMIIPPGVNVV